MTPTHGNDGAPSWNIGRYVYLRALAVCLLLGFLALYRQAPGLVGQRGILPLGETLQHATAEYGHWAYLRILSLFWISSSDAFIRLVALTGFVASGLLLVGIAPRACCLVAWLAWRSYVATEALTPGYFFFDWPYDRLLEEATFVGMFAAPPGLFPPPLRERQAARIPRLLLCWMAFRLVFFPGVTKLQSAHSAWLDGSAIQRFLETVPSPTSTAAWVFDSPAWVFLVMTWVTLVYELVGPFLYFVPGRARRWSALVGIPFMVLIQSIGNFRGFNIMTVGLLFLLVDDQWFLRVLPAGFRRWWEGAPPEPAPRSPARTIGHGALAGVVALASVLPILIELRVPLHWRIEKGLSKLDSLHLSSTYSMFCAVPVQRRVIALQGSDDGERWEDYQSIAVPVRVDREPVRVAPYQDYLGFVMWRDAIKPPRRSERWLPMLQRRILEGAPETLGLFREVPFRDRPPRYVRAVLYHYHYAPAEERARGTWWRRDFKSWFSPVRTLAEGDRMVDLSPETLEPL